MTGRALAMQRRLFGNTAVLSASEAIGQLANFAFVVCLARVFGKDVLGVYAFAMAIGGSLAVLMSFGTLRLVLRRLSRVPGRTAGAVGALCGFQVIVGALLLLATHVTARLLSPATEVVWIVTLVVSYHLLSRLSMLFLLGYQARQEMGPAAAVQIGRRGAVLALGGLAMLAGANAVTALAAMPLSALLVLAVQWVFAANRFGRPRLRLRRVAIAAYLRHGLPFFYVTALSTLHVRLGIVYLVVLSGEREAGVFAAAERLVAAAGTVYVMFATALFPVVSRLWAHERDRVIELVHRSARLILLITLPLATLFALFAGDIVELLYGASYRDAGGVLAAVAWVLVVRGVGHLLATTSQATDHQGLLGSSRTVGLILLTAASAILVPANGAMGLVAAVLVSEVSATAVNYRLLQRAGVPVMRFDGGIRVALACLTAAAVAYLLADQALWLGVLATVGAGAAALRVFGAVRSNDFTYLRAILNARSR